MKRRKTFFALLVFASMMSTTGLVNAQALTQEAPDWRKLHYLSEEEMHLLLIYFYITVNISGSPSVMAIVFS